MLYLKLYIIWFLSYWHMMSSNIHSLPESHFRHNAIVIYDHVHSIGLFTPTRQGRTRMVSTIRWRRSTSKNKVSTYKTLHLEAIKHARAFQTFGHVFFEKLSPCSSSVPPDGSESARIQQITRTNWNFWKSTCVPLPARLVKNGVNHIMHIYMETSPMLAAAW